MTGKVIYYKENKMSETMTNEQLMNKVRKEYEDRKAELNKDLHDYNYWELYMLYELSEWLDTIVREYPEDNNNKELLDFLKEQADPLGWLFNVMLDLEDDMWDSITNATYYQMRWEKEHKQ
jgi:hypothetical protein